MIAKRPRQVGEIDEATVFANLVSSHVDGGVCPRKWLSPCAYVHHNLSQKVRLSIFSRAMKRQTTTTMASART